MPEQGRLRVLALAGLLTALFVAVYHGLFLGRDLFVHDTLIWYGAFHFFVENLAEGIIPYWDPYQLGGTPFYPYNSLFGNLDPLVLLLVLVRKLTGVSPLALYVAFRILRLFIFIAGQFLLFRRLTRDGPSAMMASGILLFIFPLSYFRQFGALDAIYLTPFALFFLLRFLEDPRGPRRSAYLAALTLVTGISMAIYIPAFYAFNLAFFAVLLFAFRAADHRMLLEALRDRRFALFAAACVLAAGMMTAPSLAVMTQDASAKGDLFPMQRIIQRNNGEFKQLVASDISESNLSNRFTNQRALYNSWGQVVNLLFPDMVTFTYWREHDLQSEIDHYIGVIPLVLAVVGFLSLRSPLRWVLFVMLLLNLVNGFSTEGFFSKPYNAVQQFFNMIFPPLTMYQGRENLGYFVMMYLCSFAAAGIAMLYRDPEALRDRGRLIIGIAAGAIGAKLFITAVFADAFPVISFYDAYALLQLGLLITAVVLFIRGTLPHKALILFLTVLVLTDLVWYNVNAKEHSLQEGKPYYRMVDSATAERGQDLQLFREPAVPGLAFQESISRTRGALSLGLNHSLFTTKRFYDLFTNVPPGNQFMLNGMVDPILRFFPAQDAVWMDDRGQLLAALRSADPNDLRDRLFLERGRTGPDGAGTMEDFSRYADAPWLRPDELFSYTREFFANNRTIMEDARSSADRYLRSPLHVIRVRETSVNELVLEVRNVVDGYVLFADGWSRHWRAYDGDRELPVLPANYNGKAVLLTSGNHLVRFVYDPLHYKAALLAYAAALLASAAAAAILWRRSAGTPPGPGGATA